MQNLDVEIAMRLQEVRSLLPEGVELVAVSKFQPVEALMAAYGAGQRAFGESRVQEFVEKYEVLPKDIRWHFIGHLQTNKVRHIIGKTSLVESVDSLRLLALINEESAKAGVTTDVLLQVHVAAEETKFGFGPDELMQSLEAGDFLGLSNVRIRGLMAMATNTDDAAVIRRDFAAVASLFREMSRSGKVDAVGFDTLSMGMSADWPIAVEEGATSIRIGSAIFGERHY